MDQQVALSNLLLDENFQKLNNALKKKTIFDILQIENKELPFTRLLAWLLDPHADHRMGATPIRSFLRHCLRASQNAKFKINALQYELLNFADIRLSSEFPISTNMTARDGMERAVNGRFDVYADYPDMKDKNVRHPLLVIEAKIEASQHNSQTLLYQKWVMERCGKNSPVQPVLVYLTPEKNRNEPVADNFIPIDFNQVNSWLESLRPVLKSKQADFFINELHALNARTNRAESTNLDDLAQLIIQRNEDSIATLKAFNRLDSCVIDEYEQALVHLGLLSSRRGSLGYDEHITRVREAAQAVFQNDTQWRISGGEGSLTLRYLPFQNAINQLFQARNILNLDCWLDRSKNFLEIAVYSIKNKMPQGVDDKSLRKSLVETLRSLLQDAKIDNISIVDTDTFQVARIDLPRGTTTVASATERLKALESFGSLISAWLENGFEEWNKDNL
jgi:hypothetical protein